MKARGDLLASKENVSAWKVSQGALLMVKADSWESLGFQMQQVPTLNHLLVTEGKVRESNIEVRFPMLHMFLSWSSKFLCVWNLYFLC